MEGVEPVSSDMNNQNSNPEQSDSSKQQSVPFFSLFAAADKIDYVLMFVGSLGACIHGAALPVFFVLFGRMIDSLGHLSSNPHRLACRISEVNCNFIVFVTFAVLKSDWHTSSMAACFELGVSWTCCLGIGVDRCAFRFQTLTG